MQTYRELLITSAASMAMHLLADQAVAKTEEARRELGSNAYDLLDYALSVEGEFPVTPELEMLLTEVATPFDVNEMDEMMVAPDNEIPIERIDFSKPLLTKFDFDVDVDFNFGSHKEFIRRYNETLPAFFALARNRCRPPEGDC